MSRRRRVDFEGAIHHVMNRGVDHQPVFFADADRVEFGRRLGSIHRDFGVETLAYCLMGNHYHLLLRTPDARLPAAMQQLGSLYTRHTNDRVGRDGPLFRGRYHSIPVSTDSYFVWVARYIHRNPLALPDVRSPSEYRWSSYRAYLGLRRSPPFLITEPLVSAYSGEVQQLVDMTEDRDIGYASGLPLQAHDVLQLVRFAIAVDELSSDGPTDEPRVLERSLALLVAVEELAATEAGGDVVARLGFPSDTARRMALHRARKRLRTDDGFRRIRTRLTAELGRPIDNAA